VAVNWGSAKIGENLWAMAVEIMEKEGGRLCHPIPVTMLNNGSRVLGVRVPFGNMVRKLVWQAWGLKCGGCFYASIKLTDHDLYLAEHDEDDPSSL